jgi:4-diphosphocytidyl-2-C-methyl-D-erythritol kinase
MAYNLASMTVLVRSFAKINLGLRIGAARDDGFHELLTVYQTIGLHDVIRVRVERGSGIEIQCADPRVPRDESNTCFRIVERALEALRAKGRISMRPAAPARGGGGGRFGECGCDSSRAGAGAEEVCAYGGEAADRS